MSRERWREAWGMALRCVVAGAAIVAWWWIVGVALSWGSR